MPRTLSEQEFTAIKARVLQALPAGLSEQDFARALGPRLEAAIGEAENTPAPVEGSAVGRFASNVADQAIGGVKGLWNAAPIPQALGGSGVVQGPLNAAKGLWEAHAQQYQQARDLAQQGRYTEAAGHALAAVVPLLGPQAAQAGEQIAGGDVAGGLGQATGLLAPFAAKYGLELASAPNPAKADLLRRDAEQTVSQRVLAPGNPKYKGTAQTIAPEILQRGMQGSRLELQQLADEGLSDAADKIDAAVDAHSQQRAGVIDTQPIVTALDKRLDAMKVQGVDLPTSAGRIKQLTALRDYVSKLGNTASFEDAKRIRDDFYRTADEAKGYQGPDVNVPDVGWAAREAGSAIRQQLAAQVPGLADANADYTFFKRVGDVLDPTIGRPKNVVAAPSGVTGGQSTAGAIVGAAAAAGSHIPGLQGVSALVMSRVLPAMIEARNSPAYQLLTAQKKMALADAIERGDMGRARSLLANSGIALTAANGLTSKDSQ